MINRPAAALLLAGALAAAPSTARAESLQLSDIAMDANAGGFIINGEAAYDYAGRGLSDAGDVNGDGVGDIIVGAYGNGAAGASYVIFGRSGGTSVDLADIAMDANAEGFAIHGETAGDEAGYKVSGAGDVNGDGLDDLVIGAPYESTIGQWSGAAYVVFGKAGGTAVELSDIAMDGNAGGYVIFGAAAYNRAGRPVAGAGDVNGDGLADIAFGTLGANASAVVFGKADGTSQQLSNIAMDANAGGFIINGAGGDSVGLVTAGAGDVNGDGLADVILGAPNAAPNGVNSGRCYVVFGKTDGTSVPLADIASETSSAGFALHGAAAYERAGSSASGAGDVNGDGRADVIVGASGADSYAGRAYVVFGKATTTAVELSDIASDVNGDGFVVLGAASADAAGKAVSGAHDVNGDGHADVIVGAPTLNPATRSHGGYGTDYLVYGKSDGTSVSLSDVEMAENTEGLAMHTATTHDDIGYGVSGAGDFDGDGLPDILLGAEETNSRAGAVYLVFSPATPNDYSDYFAFALPGDGADGAIVPELALKDARMRVDFSDDDAGDDGSGGPSLQSARLYRSNAAVSNVAPIVADVAWSFVTDRTSFDSVRLTVHYIESEAASIVDDGGSLALFTASAPDGPWTAANATHDADRREFSVDIASADLPVTQYLAIGLSADTVWAKFDFEGTEIGTRSMPFNTLQEAIDAVNSGGTVKLDGTSSVTNDAGTYMLSKPMTLQSVDGTVTIGAP